jgi:hypothetical protein
VGENLCRSNPWMGIAELSRAVSTTIRRIGQGFSPQPYRVDNLRSFNDRHFVDKVIDVVGLYMSPSAHAGVLCVDEKSHVPGTGTESACPIHATGYGCHVKPRTRSGWTRMRGP